MACLYTSSKRASIPEFEITFVLGRLVVHGRPPWNVIRVIVCLMNPSALRVLADTMFELVSKVSYIRLCIDVGFRQGLFHLTGALEQLFELLYGIVKLSAPNLPCQRKKVTL